MARRKSLDKDFMLSISGVAMLLLAAFLLIFVLNPEANQVLNALAIMVIVLYFAGMLGYAIAQTKRKK